MSGGFGAPVITDMLTDLFEKANRAPVVGSPDDA